MSDETLKLIGKLISPEERRDAIHVAVAPVEAGEALKPGDRIGFNFEGLMVRPPDAVGKED